MTSSWCQPSIKLVIVRLSLWQFFCFIYVRAIEIINMKKRKLLTLTIKFHNHIPILWQKKTVKLCNDLTKNNKKFVLNHKYDILFYKRNGTLNNLSVLLVCLWPGIYNGKCTDNNANFKILQVLNMEIYWKMINMYYIWQQLLALVCHALWS